MKKDRKDEMAEALALRREADDLTVELIRQARAGDLMAFDSLVHRHQRRVLRLACQMVGNADDAQDVAQDVFIRLWKYLDRIRDTAKFSTWLYRMVVNCSYDLLSRRRISHDHVSLDDPGNTQHELTDENAIAIDREVAASELRDKVLGSLSRLTPSERTVFVLRDIEGLEVKEIAVIHESSAITVRRHLSSARHKMRAVLIELYPGFARDDKEGDSTP